jgi:hypothetical protein
MLKMRLSVFKLVLLIGLGIMFPAWQALADTAQPVPTEEATPAEKPLPKTNAEIRQWYNDQVAPITQLNEKWIKEGLSAEERAKRAYEIRHNARIKAREMMPNKEEVTQLQKRDMEKYGNPDGPTFDYLVQKNREAGLTGDAVYEAILNSSDRTNPEYNKKFGVQPSK